MPRRKSQPAKYSEAVTESRTDGSDGDQKEYSHYPTTSDGSHSDYAEDSQDANSSPKSEDSTYYSSVEHCRSDETSGRGEYNESHFPLARRQRVMSQEENPFTDSLNSNHIKPDDVPEIPFYSISSNSTAATAKPKFEENLGSYDANFPNVNEQKNSISTEIKTTMPKTLQEYVYRVIDIYYRQQFASETSINDTRGMNDLNVNTKGNRHSIQESSENEPNEENSQMTLHSGSLQDAINTYKNGLKLVAELEQFQGSIIPKPPLSLNGNSGNDNEVCVKTIGSMPADLDQCGTCFKILKRSSMREHMDRHNNTGRYRCSVCMKAFSKLSSKEKHELIHTDQRPFKCDKCEKAYRQKIHLVEHIRSHTGERPYVCPYCNYSLASKSLLNRHVKTHEPAKQIDNEILQNKKPEVLRLTPKKEVSSQKVTEKRCIEPLKLKLQSKFAANDKLRTGLYSSSNKNENLQTSNSIFKCPKCSNVFSSARRLGSHIHNVHKTAQPHPCPDCSKSFAHSSSLMKHRATEHGHRSLSLVNVVPTRRKSMQEESRPAQEDNSPVERNCDNSVKADISDKSDTVPAKFPRLSVNGSDEDLNSPSSVEKDSTSNCELIGSDS